MKTFMSLFYCIVLAIFSVLIVSFAIKAIDTSYDEGLYEALNNQEPFFRGYCLEYDEYGAPTLECINHLKNTIFKGRKFDESKIWTGCCIPSEDEIIELERIFKGVANNDN